MFDDPRVISALITGCVALASATITFFGILYVQSRQQKTLDKQLKHASNLQETKLTYDKQEAQKKLLIEKSEELVKETHILIEALTRYIKVSNKVTIESTLDEFIAIEYEMLSIVIEMEKIKLNIKLLHNMYKLGDNNSYKQLMYLATLLKSAISENYYLMYNQKRSAPQFPQTEEMIKHVDKFNQNYPNLEKVMHNFVDSIIDHVQRNFKRY